LICIAETDNTRSIANPVSDDEYLRLIEEELKILKVLRNKPETIDNNDIISTDAINDNDIIIINNNNINDIINNDITIQNNNDIVNDDKNDVINNDIVASVIKTDIMEDNLKDGATGTHDLPADTEPYLDLQNDPGVENLRILVSTEKFSCQNFRSIFIPTLHTYVHTDKINPENYRPNYSI
jgi:hypothetical protein